MLALRIAALLPALAGVCLPAGQPGQGPYEEPGAAWRAEAAARIDRLRKADLAVKVLDSAGKPLPGAAVRVRMLRHAFPFGSAVAASALLGDGPDNRRYRETVLQLFNKAVLENDLKWPQWEANRQRALDALAWLHANGLPDVRGHTMVWPGWKWLPKDLPGLAGDPGALRARVNRHIADVGGVVRGLVTEWDVINEPYSNRDLQKILGDEAMVEWFKIARQADPGAALYINDYGILAAGGKDEAHQNHYFKTIRYLEDSGAPVQGIGMQGHFSRNLTAPARLWEILDRFGALNKPIQITEFDIDIDDEQLQAAYTRDFLTAVFAHPAVKGFLMWGFWEGRHWRPRGAMFRRDWSVKPNGEAFRDLILRQWWTDERGIAAEDGTYRLRAFQGRYEVEAAAGGRVRRVETALGSKGAEVTMSLD